MALRAFKIQKTGNRQLDQLQRDIYFATKTARESPFGDGILIPNLRFTANVVHTVSHSLGRAYQGFFVGRYQPDSTSLVSNPFEVNPQPADIDLTRTVALRCTVNCTCSLWMY